MNPQRVRRAAAELVVYLCVSLITCVFVEVVLHRHELGNGSISAALWKVLPVALPSTAGIWLGLTLAGITLARKKPKPPPC